MSHKLTDKQVKQFFEKAVEETAKNEKSADISHEHEAEDYMNTILHYAKASHDHKKTAEKVIKEFKPAKDQKDAYNEMKERFDHFFSLSQDDRDAVVLHIRKERV